MSTITRRSGTQFETDDGAVKISLAELRQFKERGSLPVAAQSCCLSRGDVLRLVDLTTTMIVGDNITTVASCEYLRAIPLALQPELVLPPLEPKLSKRN